jgi:hypothetical protein
MFVQISRVRVTDGHNGNVEMQTESYWGDEALDVLMEIASAIGDNSSAWQLFVVALPFTPHGHVVYDAAFEQHVAYLRGQIEGARS